MATARNRMRVNRSQPARNPLCWGILVFSALLPHCWPQEPANRRIHDVRLIAYRGETYRIVIHLSELTEYRITAPGPGAPLRIELARTEVDPGVRAKPPSNDLVRGVWITPSDVGVVTLEIPLATSQVQVKDYTVSTPEAMVVVDLTLRPGVRLPAPEGSPLPAAETQPSTPALHPVVALPQEGAPEAAPPRADLSMSATDLGAGRASPTGGLPLGVPAPPATGRGPAVPRAGQAADSGAPASARDAATPLSPDLIARNFFPYQKVELQFPGAEKLVDAYGENRFLNAFKAGLTGLLVPQPQKSMESLLHLLAECRYQYEVSRLAESPTAVPDWEAVLNCYRQAKLFSRDSPFRPIADYRISQIYSRMGRYAEQEGVLLSLRGREDFFELPNAAQILFESGWAALQLHRASPTSTDYLLRAQDAFEAFMNRFPESDLYVTALLLLGEAYYNQGDDVQAYNTILTSLGEGQKRGIRTLQVKLVFPDIYPHFGLAGHRLGKIDIVNPRTRNDASFAEEVRKSGNPAIRLEYARLLAEARDVPGPRLQAMRHYNAVAQGMDGMTSPTAAQVFEARSTLMRFALDDIRAGKLDPNVSYPSYAQPFDTYYDLYENSFDLSLRTKLLLEQADFHLSQGQPLRAFLLLLPHFKPRFLPEEIASQLRDGLWGIVPGATKAMRDTRDYRVALQAYPAFAGPLADHPVRDAFLVDGAQILMDADLRADAARAVELIGAYADLPAPEQGRLTAIQKELRLDPADPESLKRDAPALLDPQYDERRRARVARLLGDVYRAEGNHAYAAQVYSQAFRYKNLPLLERMDFYEKTAREYGAAAIDGKVVETLYLAFVDLEENEDDVDFPGTGEIRGEFLLMLAESYQRLGHLDKAARAYEEYLGVFPKGVHASSTRYRLALVSERENDPARALEHYDLLAGQQGADAFWAEAARKSADHLRWEQKHAYLTAGESQP